MKKLTQQEFIDRVVSLHPGLDFSEYIYSNYSGKSTVICKVHGPYLAKAGVLLNGHGCSKCYSDRRGTLRRTPLDKFIATAREKHGDKYDYSSMSFTGIRKSINVICPEHGIFKVTASCHLDGAGCPECRKANGNPIALTTARFMESLAKSRPDHGYDLSRVVLVNSKSVITVICPEHGEFYPTASNFLYQKSGCPKCASAKRGLSSRKSNESLIAQFREVHGDTYHYIGFEFNGKRTVQYVCPRHGFVNQLVDSHLRGHGCSKCGIDVYNTATFVNKAISVHGTAYDYSRVEYTNAFNKVEIVCPKHGSFWQGPTYHVNNGHGCPLCASVGPSAGQLELAEAISKFARVELECSTTRFRADILLPEHGIAVEYHGLIWHSEKYKTNLQYDYEKHRFMEDLGIRTIHIYADEWDLRRKQVIALIRNAVGMYRGKVYARLCSVSLVEHDEACKFHEDNHIQGGAFGVGTVTHYGLRFLGELVAVMSFSRVVSNRSYTGNKSDVELRRFSTSVNVVGGASRLLKAFIRDHSPTLVISYSDNRLFTGGMYRALGFTKAEVLAPDYCYVSPKSRVRVSKRAMARDRMPKLDNFNFQPELTEVENAHANNWYRLFDCGKTRWELHI